MRHLCDSNVFVALVISRHLHHSVALKWFDALPDGDTATFCRMTQNSFLRLLTTDEFMRPYTLTNAKALATYRTMLKDARVEFMVEPPGLEEGWLSAASISKMSPKLWMDAYLAAFSRLSGARFVTFDKAFRQFGELDLLLLRP
jgi:toxin-antitoxin system PIN domain toxin